MTALRSISVVYALLGVVQVCTAASFEWADSPSTGRRSSAPARFPSPAPSVPSSSDSNTPSSLRGENQADALTGRRRTSGLLQSGRAQPTTRDEQREGYFRKRVKALIRRPRCSFHGIEETLTEQQKELIALVKDAVGGNDLTGIDPLLLHGPPGTGKTRFAEALAHEAQIMFCPIGTGSLKRGFAGDGAMRIEALRECLKGRARVAIFIDEIDALGSRETLGEGSAAANMVDIASELWMLMEDPELSRNTIFIAATNMLNRLDESLQRRFCEWIQFRLPSIRQINVVKDYYCSRAGYRLAEGVVLPCESSRWQLADVVLPNRFRDKLSYSDIHFLIKRAGILAKLHKSEVIKQEHMDAAWVRLVEKKRQGRRITENDKRNLGLLVDRLSSLGVSYYGVREGRSQHAENLELQREGVSVQREGIALQRKGHELGEANHEINQNQQRLQLFGYVKDCVFLLLNFEAVRTFLSENGKAALSAAKKLI